MLLIWISLKILSSANAFNLDQSKILSFGRVKHHKQVISIPSYTVNPLINLTTLWQKKFLKIIWEKEKMLVTSLFSTSHPEMIFLSPSENS